MPLFSVLERNPQTPPTLRQYGHRAFILHADGEGACGQRETDGAATWCPGNGVRSPLPTCHQEPGRWHLSARLFLFCSPGQNSACPWSLGDSAGAFVCSAQLRSNLARWSLEKRKRQERGEGG